MDEWQTIGHENVKRVLHLHIRSGMLPHAYLFRGPAGVGKYTLAREYAGQLLGTDRPGSHPDFQILQLSDGSSVESVREFMSSLSFKPAMAAWRIAVLNDAQLLNDQSSNALLKTLEEPASRTVIILISSHMRLLPTIMSRCQLLHFHSLAAEELSRIAVSQNWKLEPGMLELSRGSAGVLSTLLSDGKNWRAIQSRALRYEELKRSRTGDRLLAVAEFAELETDELAEAVEQWLAAEAGRLELEPAAALGRSRALLQARQLLRTNKNKKMVLQELFLKL